MDTHTHDALAAARQILAKNMTPLGIMASTQVYQQVWARDSVITFLGGALDKSSAALAGFRTTLATLAANRDRFGQIPSLVHCADGRAEFGSTDANPCRSISPKAPSRYRQRAPFPTLKTKQERLIEEREWDAEELTILPLRSLGDWEVLVGNWILKRFDGQARLGRTE